MSRVRKNGFRFVVRYVLSREFMRRPKAATTFHRSVLAWTPDEAAHILHRHIPAALITGTTHAGLFKIK